VVLITPILELALGQWLMRIGLEKYGLVRGQGSYRMALVGSVPMELGSIEALRLRKARAML